MIRIGDLDVQGHVNNVAVAAILQEARGGFNKRLLAHHLDGHGLVVGSLFIDYAGEMHFPDPVEVSVGVLEIGRSSFVLGQVARQRGRIAAYAEMALVVTAGGRGAPIPGPMRAALEDAIVVGR
jgi:acyl-CoA thioester hydrolase